MGLDPFGQWHPLCDLSPCKDDQVDDGQVEVDVFVGGEIRTARIDVCAGHRDELVRDRRSLVMFGDGGY